MGGNKKICFPCPSGTYSFLSQIDNNSVTESCKLCQLEKVKECGNSTIILKDGYWRLNSFSDVIEYCENKPENCNDKEEAIGYCKRGLVGPLCELCDTNGDYWENKYSNVENYVCAPCWKNGHYFYQIQALKDIIKLARTVEGLSKWHRLAIAIGIDPL